ncbi:MAG: glycosyltransferase [Candidatus Nanoclepta minutus]|uniref:Glycosyltransferase n=1 Tax=Candidatus Nanoclepta minutus TaxID=1940235 RepID=A0A397WMD2_9ARCH|nr:MAG: glycosyltransferase [Candidatus Nanoclepta minutus]
MRILLFHPWIKSKGGAERLILEYIRRSKHKIDILTWVYLSDKSFEEFKKYKIISIFPEYLESVSRSFLLRGSFGILSIIKNILKEGFIENYDLLLISTSGIAELILLNKKINIPVVLYVHTPLRATYKYDIYWNFKYRFKNVLYKAVYKLALHSYNYLERKAWKRVSFAIFNSELSRKRALDKKLIDIEKTKVIYPGVDINLEPKNQENYFLYISRIGMAKRQEILLYTWKMFSKKYGDYKLILAGNLENKKYYRKLLRIIKVFNLRNVEILTNLPSEKIKGLHEHSLCEIQVPFMEDFGIAPLESVAAGKYLINVYPSGNYELLKDFPGIYWIKERIDNIKMAREVYKAMEYFIKNQDKLINLGSENRKRFKRLDLSWDRFAKEMDKTLESLIFY